MGRIKSTHWGKNRFPFNTIFEIHLRFFWFAGPICFDYDLFPLLNYL